MNTENKMPIFSKRFNELRGQMTQAEFADFIGISRPTVGFYENGSRIPDAAVLKQICEKCKCSSGWLLGITDAKTLNISIQAVCKFTGLSEKAVSRLQDSTEANKKDAMILAAEILLEHD